MVVAVVLVVVVVGHQVVQEVPQVVVGVRLLVQEEVEASLHQTLEVVVVASHRTVHQGSPSEVEASFPGKVVEVACLLP
jgi:hypothetical protein